MSARLGKASTATEGPVQPGGRQGLLLPGMVQPQAVGPDVPSGSVSQAPGSTDLQAQILTDDPRLDLGATAETLAESLMPAKSASLRPAVPDDGDLMLSRTSSDGLPRR
jgi:hypothetical protein